MAIEFEIIPNPDNLHVEVSGIFDMQEAIDKFASVIAACKNKNQYRVLIDFRQVEGYIESTEKLIYTMGITDLLKIHNKSGVKLLYLA